LCSVDSDDLEKQDLLQYHHYIAHKDYDRTIMNKLNSPRNVDLLTKSIQQDQLEQVDNSALKNKRLMLIEDEVDLVMLFKMILESNAGLKVDSFTTVTKSGPTSIISCKHSSSICRPATVFL